VRPPLWLCGAGSPWWRRSPLISCIGQLSLILYATLYTSLPTIVVGILDQDLSPATLLRWPALYAPGIHEDTYNLSAFLLLMLDVFWQSGVMFGGRADGRERRAL